MELPCTVVSKQAEYGFIYDNILKGHFKLL